MIFLNLAKQDVVVLHIEVLTDLILNGSQLKHRSILNAKLQNNYHITLLIFEKLKI